MSQPLKICLTCRFNATLRTENLIYCRSHKDYKERVDTCPRWQRRTQQILLMKEEGGAVMPSPSKCEKCKHADYDSPCDLTMRCPFYIIDFPLGFEPTNCPNFEADEGEG